MTEGNILCRGVFWHKRKKLRESGKAFYIASGVVRGILASKIFLEKKNFYISESEIYLKYIF